MQRRKVLTSDMVDIDSLELGIAGDDMAACLERFLGATADEPTMQRARRAVAHWHGVRSRQATTQGAGSTRPVVVPAADPKPRAAKR